MATAAPLFPAVMHLVDGRTRPALRLVFRNAAFIRTVLDMLGLPFLLIGVLVLSPLGMIVSSGFDIGKWANGRIARSFPMLDGFVPPAWVGSAALLLLGWRRFCLKRGGVGRCHHLDLPGIRFLPAALLLVAALVVSWRVTRVIAQG